MKHITILEFPSNLGLKEPARGVEPGVKKMPAWLKEHGFHEQIAPSMIYSLTPPRYSMQLDKESGVRNADAIIVYAKQQRELLKKVIADKSLPLVIGGDCSILTGNALALKETGRYGLFFLDGHTDFMMPELSETAGAAGMDLAIVTGYGHEKLTNIDQQRPYVNERNVWCVGNREYDPDYVAAIRQSGIHYVDLAVLDKMGTTTVVNNFLDMINANELDGFWLHIDLDVLHHDIMPAVDSPDPGGMPYQQFNALLLPLLTSQKLTGLELTILDPDLDPGAEYTRRFIEEFTGVFNKAREMVLERDGLY